MKNFLPEYLLRIHKTVILLEKYKTTMFKCIKWY